MISAPTRATFEIATIMKTIDITLSIDVALSKTLLALIIKNIEIPNTKPKAGIRYLF